MKKLQWEALYGISIQDTLPYGYDTSAERHHSAPMFSRKKKYFCVLLATTTIFLLLQNLKTFDEPLKPDPDMQRVQDFKRDWCRIRNMRVNWERILEPCRGRTGWNIREPGWGKDNETDPDSSYISMWDIKPAGEFSRFSITTQTKSGKPKIIGGDSWRVHINGPASVEGTVIDHMNGTYEVLFLLIKPGVFNIEIILDHSLCNGLTDPPPDWFIKG